MVWLPVSPACMVPGQLSKKESCLVTLYCVAIANNSFCIAAVTYLGSMVEGCTLDNCCIDMTR